MNNKLSKREIEVLGLMAQGKNNKEIATQLFLSERTIKNHVSNIYKKFGLNNRIKVIRFYLTFLDSSLETPAAAQA